MSEPCKLDLRNCPHGLSWERFIHDCRRDSVHLAGEVEALRRELVEYKALVAASFNVIQAQVAELKAGLWPLEPCDTVTMEQVKTAMRQNNPEA